MSTFSTAASGFSAVRHQPVAKKTAAARRRHIKQVAILISVGVVLALLYVWVRIEVIQQGYEVSRIRKEVTDLGVIKGRIEADVEALKSPTRIEVIAREKFGMRLPMADEIVLVDIK